MQPNPSGYLAVFDLDNTLLDGDSDYGWASFLVDQGYMSATELAEKSAEFQEDYNRGALDLDAYIAFVSGPIQRLWPDRLAAMQIAYVQQIRRIMLPAAQNLLAQHRARGDYTMIMTATCNVIAEGICEAFGVDSWMATTLEMDAGGYTGTVSGVPCFRQGKRTLLDQWVDQREQFALHRAWFYSDSHNDLPLLEAVAMPVAVDPDPTLRTHAQARDWEILSLRHTSCITEIPYAQKLHTVS